jgi:hypothetical protein
MRFFTVSSFHLRILVNYKLTSIVFGAMDPAWHYISHLVWIVLLPQFVDFDGVVVEQIDKLSQKLYLYNFVRVSGFGISRLNFAVIILIIMFTDHWQKHIIHLVGCPFSLEKCEKHSFENFDLDDAVFVFNQLI